MRGKTAKKLRRMAEAMAEIKPRTYMVKKYETRKRNGKGQLVKVSTHTIWNAPNSVRGVYRNLKKGGRV